MREFMEKNPGEEALPTEAAKPRVDLDGARAITGSSARSTDEAGNHDYRLRTVNQCREAGRPYLPLAFWYQRCT
jgi:hypothetical protein